MIACITALGLAILVVYTASGLALLPTDLLLSGKGGTIATTPTEDLGRRLIENREQILALEASTRQLSERDQRVLNLLRREEQWA